MSRLPIRVVSSQSRLTARSGIPLTTLLTQPLPLATVIEFLVASLVFPSGTVELQIKDQITGTWTGAGVCLSDRNLPTSRLRHTGLALDDQRSKTIRTTGVAMSLPKICDSDSPISPSPERSRHFSRSVRQALKADCSKIKPDEPGITRLTFLQDFTLEHSLQGLRITTIEIAGIF